MAPLPSSARRRRRSAGPTVVVVAVGSAWLGACAASPGGYSDAAEEFLRSDEVYEAYQIDFLEPDCADPPSNEVGAQLACRATGSDDVPYRFDLRITGKNELELVAITPLWDQMVTGTGPRAGAPPGSTAAPGRTAPPGSTAAPGRTAPPGRTAAPGRGGSPTSTTGPGRTTAPPGRTTAPPGPTTAPPGPTTTAPTQG